MDAYLLGVFSLAAVSLALALTVAVTGLLRGTRRGPTGPVLLPGGGTERPGPDRDEGAYAGVGGGPSADARTRQSVGSG